MTDAQSTVAIARTCDNCGQDGAELADDGVLALCADCRGVA